MSTITYPNTQFIVTNGSTGTTITSTSITTPNLFVNNIVDSNGSTGKNGNILSSTGNGIEWIPLSGTTGNSGITGNINMNTYNITNATNITCTNLNATNINMGSSFANQITFTSSPSCSTEPTEATNIVTKNYVDNSQPSVYNLFLNQSQTTTVPLAIGSTGYSKLSDLVIATVQASPLARTITAGTTGGILSFISDPINITNLPACILNVNIYGNNITAGNFSIYYICNIRLYSGTGSGITITTLGTSQSSSILTTFTASYPLMYTMPVSVSSRTTLPADRFIIELFARNTSASNVTLNTHFENKFYSYIQLQSNTTISFKPSNTFSVNSANSDLSMNGFNISSTGNLDISCPTKILSLGNKASTINIEKQTSGNIYIGNTGGINIGKPLNINYITNSVTNNLGYVYEINPSNVVPSTGLFAAGTAQVCQARFVITLSGVWLFNFWCGGDSYNTTAKTGYSVYVYKNNTASASNYIYSQHLTQSFTSTNQIVMNCTGTINIPTTDTLLIVLTTYRTLTTANGRALLSALNLIRIG